MFNFILNLIFDVVLIVMVMIMALMMIVRDSFHEMIIMNMLIMIMTREMAEYLQGY